MGSLYARTTLSWDIFDWTGGFNGFTRPALTELMSTPFLIKGYGFQIEIKYRAIRRGFRVVEFPIVFKERQRGESKMNPAIFVEAMLGVLRLRLGS